MTALTKQEWYQRAADFIVDNLDEFYQHFYVSELSGMKMARQGRSLALEPCPNCGHNGCCKVNEKGVHCFSCKWSGTHINALTSHYSSFRKKTYGDAINNLAEFIGDPFPAETKEEIEANRKHQRQQDILRRAADFYHTQLLLRKEEYLFKDQLMTPLNYLLNVRKRNIDTIEDFKVGFSANWLELRLILLNNNFTEQEIDDAKVRIPDGLFVYFYLHPRTHEIIRYNTKNPFGTTIYGGKDPIAGLSWGPKVLFYSPQFSFKKPIILVEGENDLMSVYEAGYQNVACLGGMPSEDSLSALERCESEILVAFDHDAAGDGYLETVNRLYPEKILRKISFPSTYNDIDEFFVNALPGEFNIHDMVEKAEEIFTAEFKPRCVNNNVWIISNRYKKLEFIINRRPEGKALTGQINLYNREGVLVDREDNKSLASCRANKQPMSFKLADAIKSHFDENLDSRSFEDLATIYWNSSHQQHIVKLLAQRISENYEEREDMVMRMRELMSDLPNSRDIADEVLKELNDLQIRANVQDGEIRTMQYSHFFSIRDNRAYFYFVNTKIDVDAKRLLPYFLRNDKTLIRLDLIKRRDPQCMLLVDNHYKLMAETPTIPIEPKFCSLTKKWVDKFVDNEIDPAELDPKFVVQSLENFIRRFYYHSDDSVYKMLALWSYGTYFYDMFKVFPYLYINGEKGSGKSALGKTLEMTAFNGRLLVHTSESCLFRIAGLEGGTLILDEQENLQNRKKGSESTFGPIIKGGYTKGQNVARFDFDGKRTDYFDPYCPKVIINILGLDDIIGDRCIEIKSYRVKVNKDLRLEDPMRFQDENIDFFREMTSKCALSAMENFQTLSKVYDQSLFVTKNARLSQILNPIMAVARMVDIKERADKRQAFPDLHEEQIIGEYESAFNHFYNYYVLSSKDEVEGSTPEGIIKQIVPAIARELVVQDRIPASELQFINMAQRKYNEPIKYNAEQGWFKINALHFKTFVEEYLPGEVMSTRNLTRIIKTCYDLRGADIERKSTKIENEALSKELLGHSTSKVYYYRFFINDFVTQDFLENGHDPVDQKPVNEIKAQLF